MKIVFDVDGTLSDPTHRLHFITGEWKDWDSFFRYCGGDGYHAAAIATLRAFVATGAYVELWTGRPERTRETTEAWVWNHVGTDSRNISAMRMRADGDHRPDDVVKLEYLDACGFVPDIIFEDRASVVKAYRERGLTVYQVAPGDF